MFVSLSFVEAESYGQLAKLLVFENGMLVFRFGILNDLNQIIPKVKGYMDVRRYFSTTFLYLLMTLPLLLLLLYSDFPRHIVVVGIVRIGMNYLKPFFDIAFRKNHIYDKHLLVFILVSILNVISVLFPFYLNFEGFLYRMLIIDISYMIISYLMLRSELKFIFDWELFVGMFKSGLPLFINNFLSTLFLSLPLIIYSYWLTDGKFATISFTYIGSSFAIMLGGLYYQSNQNSLIESFRNDDSNSQLGIYYFLTRVVVLNSSFGLLVALVSTYLHLEHPIFDAISRNYPFFFASVGFLSVDLYSNYFVIIGRRVFLIYLTLMKYLIFTVFCVAMMFLDISVFLSVIIAMIAVITLYFIFVLYYVRFRLENV